MRALTPEQREAERQGRVDAIGDAYAEQERRLAVRNPNLREARGARSMTYVAPPLVPLLKQVPPPVVTTATAESDPLQTRGQKR